MTVGEAKELAREWAVQRAKELPGIAGAYLFGSICLRRDEDPFPYTSDVDIRMAVEGNGHDVLTEVEGEFRSQAIEYKGLDIEIIYPSITECLDHEALLGTPWLAPAFRAQNILLDPTGVVAKAQAAVRRSYAQERWVRARCRTLQTSVLGGLDKAASDGALAPGFASEFLERLEWFHFGALTQAAGIPCMADLDGYTSRRGLSNCRKVLEAYGLPGLYGKLLDVLGAEDVTAEAAIDLLGEMESAFDPAVRYVRTRFWGGFFFQAFLRSKILDGVRELILQGHHREATLFLVHMRTLAQNALENDAPLAVKAELREGHRRLLSKLGIESPADINGKVDRLRKNLPEVMEAAETIIARNPAVEHA